MEGNGIEQPSLKFPQHTHQPPIHLRICQYKMDEYDRRNAREKTGVRHIHMLRIIGLICPEFITALSYFIGHRGQQNSKNTSPLDKQHGSCQRRQAIDAAMLKLLTMETACHGKRTIEMTQYDKKNCFDRIF